MKKQRICLIIPPSPFLVDERVFVSLGILKVAAVLERAGEDVAVLDLSGVENYGDVVSLYLNNEHPDFVGITSTSPQFPNASAIARHIRTMAPHIRICLGGPHPTMVAAAHKIGKGRGRSVLAYQQLLDVADIIVAGDGEEAIFVALQKEAPRFIDADNPESSLFLQKGTLETYPFPARHLIDLASYHYAIGGVPACSLIAQLGCPYQCTFCSGRLSPTFRTVRSRTGENVRAEIQQIYEQYGYRGFQFYDDELNVDRNLTQNMIALADLQRKLGVSFHCRGFIKSNLFTIEQARALRAAGFQEVLIGFESGSERILTNIRKKATKAQNTHCMEIADQCGLRVKALMSIGHAGESAGTIRETCEWLLAVQPSDFDITIISPYAGCPYYDFSVPHRTVSGAWTYMAEGGDQLHSYEMDFAKDAAYYKGIPGEYRSFVWTDYISAEELVTMREWVEAEVRGKLKIPFYTPVGARRFEASMGQLPGSIYRESRE